MFGPHGRFAGVIGLLTDITDRRRLDDELRERRERLAELVSERTAELQATNEQLQLEIAERESVEARTRSSLAEKDVLLKEIHHRVKNNLQVISSLLYLQSKDLGASPALQMFADSRHRVRSMALVHERLYQSADLAHVDFAGYVQSLSAYLVRAYSAGSKGTGQADEVRLLLDVPGDVQLGIDQAIPCGLIINELVSNALKHAFPDPDLAAEIFVALRPDADGRLTLLVRDNGVGFPPDFDFSTPTSLGLQLVHTLAHQLGGEAELAQGVGTEVRVALARPHAEPA
jgi:two-component sensor histidine kinase